jgi:rhamnosyltransferase
MPSADVCVLLATHNGEPWISEQLASIARQTGVGVSVVASDDCSSDRTRELLLSSPSGIAVTQLPALPHRLGNANRNFLRLIRDAPLGEAHYVALSDQDDVWLPQKLECAVSELIRTGADAYSSNVTAFWADGRERVLAKSGPQRRYDHLFESAGPGCTFVFKRSTFLRLRGWVRDNFEMLQRLKVHDWLIYAFARHHGWRWHIDPHSHMRYRQHACNEMGANSGLRAALSRWKQVRSGQYRDDVLAIAGAIDDQSIVTRSLRELALADRVRLLMLARQCRRDCVEALMLALFFLVIPKPKSLERKV